MNKTKGIISWTKEQSPNGVLVTPSIASELVSTYEEEYHKILAIFSKMFDENKNLEYICVEVELNEEGLTILNSHVKMYLSINSSPFSMNGLKCKGD